MSQLIMDIDYLVACLFVICVKILFIPMYHSTDMEVHRNWMAITHNFNISQWYFEATSEWTLDYPPLFAWFEYALSFAAKYFDPQMLEINKLNYVSYESLFFLRMSVIISDMIYVYAIWKIYQLLKRTYCLTDDDPWLKPEVVFAMLMLWNPGLLLVDNIHFQYNGMLNGFLFLSIAAMMQDKYLQAAFWYAVLLNFKHIYIYFAPAYFVYLLKNYCFKLQNLDGHVAWNSFSFSNFFKLASVVGGVFLVSFGPFITPDQLKQIQTRIFPVKRGLTHAYWAPNIWALYNFIDRVLLSLSYYWTRSTNHVPASVTRGLVEEYKHQMLPNIHLSYTAVLTLLSLSPFLVGIWKKPKNALLFVYGLVGCAFGSFVFGYHVHEKAVAMIILPMTLLALLDPSVVKPFTLLCTVGHFSLFPLLHKSGETPIKIIVLLLHSVYAHTTLKSLHKFKLRIHYTMAESLFILGIPILQLFYSVGLACFGLEERLQFLPLMLISVYCAMGVLYTFYQFYLVSSRITSRPIKQRK